MQTLTEFKKEHNIEKLNFYKSHNSSRFVASFGDKLLVTTEDFDPKQVGYVYDNPAAEAGASWILSNKEPKEADFTL